MENTKFETSGGSHWCKGYCVHFQFYSNNYIVEFYEKGILAIGLDIS